jgi:hypothetical protein
VIVVNYNTLHLLDQYSSSLGQAESPLSVQWLFIDNASTDGSKVNLKNTTSSVSVIFNDVNVVFGPANNQAVQLLQGRYALLLNTDAFVAPDTLTKTLA